MNIQGFLPHNSSKRLLFLALTLEDGVAAEVVLRREGRGAEEDLAGLTDVADDSALGADGGVVGDVQMPRYADLTCQYAVLAESGTT